MTPSLVHFISADILSSLPALRSGNLAQSSPPTTPANGYIRFLAYWLVVQPWKAVGSLICPQAFHFFLDLSLPWQTVTPFVAVTTALGAVAPSACLLISASPLALLRPPSSLRDRPSFSLPLVLLSLSPWAFILALVYYHFNGRSGGEEGRQGRREDG